MILVLNKKYDGESIIDVQEDVWSAISKVDVPVDEQGIAKGTYIVRVEHVTDEELVLTEGDK